MSDKALSSLGSIGTLAASDTGDEFYIVKAGNSRRAHATGFPATSSDFLQAGSGAVTRTVEDKLREIVSPEDFGAVGDGVADDTTPLTNFFAYVFNSSNRAQGQSWGKTYRITSTLTVIGQEGSLDFQGSSIVPDGTVTPGLIFGTATLFGNSRVSGLRVAYASYDSGADNIPILLRNVFNTTFIDPRADNGKFGVVLAPQTGHRVAYNTFINTRASAGQYAIQYDATGTGFANENCWFGGRLTPASASLTHHIHIPNAAHNHNRFFGLSVEGTADSAVFCDNDLNVFESLRPEGTYANGAIVLGPNSNFNFVVMMRSDQDVYDQGTDNVVITQRHGAKSHNSFFREVQKLARHNAVNPNTLVGTPTADTTSNSNTITVSDASELELGDFINVVGAVNLARIEGISGTTLTLDSIASATVSGAALTRPAVPALDIADNYVNSGASYAARFYVGRPVAGAYLWRAFARDGEVASLNGLGLLTAGSFVPSSTTPPTDGMYLSGTNVLGWSIGGAAELQLSSAQFRPAANDGLALGGATQSWADLFLASGAVINWNNGNAGITHNNAGAFLLVNPGDLRVTSANVGTNADSVPTLSSTSTLTNKTIDLTSNTLTGTWHVLAASAVAASHTGDTNETTLATINVPANAMGANGILRITTVWTYTNSANNKTMRVVLGGTTLGTVIATTTASLRHQVQIHNRNAANSQHAFANSGSSFNVATGANQTGAVDTTSAQNITLTAQLANAGETITLESYTVELLRAA